VLLSRSGEYALQALIRLAQHGDERPLRTAEIAEALDAPRNYLSKLLHQLAVAGVLESTRGPSGGFRLAVDARELTLAEALEPIEATRLVRGCLLGRPQCLDSDPCSAHASWRALSEHIEQFLITTTVADLLPEAAGRSGRRRGR